MHRRRWYIVKLLQEKRELTVDALIHDDYQFRRAFRHASESTVEEDFRKIEELFRNGLTVQRSGSILTLLPTDASPFSRLGYRAGGPDNERKRRIAEFIVQELLNKDDVVYLSTGTTVCEVAAELLRSPERKAAVVLTNNQDIVVQFCQQKDRCQEQGIRFVILGGTADFATGDIALEPTLTQLGSWQCSKAIMSCTHINVVNGQIFTFRERETKEKVLETMDLDQVIIPITPEKLGRSGGQLLGRPPNKRTKYTIVTIGIDEKAKEQLKGHGFEVHSV